jgi:hypothetical protein
MRIFSSSTRFFGSKPLLGMMGNQKNIEIPTEIYRWHLHDAQVQNARVMENLEAANTAVGLNHTEFKVKLDLNYYRQPDVLMPEDPDFACEVIGDPVQEGTGYVYTLRLQGDNPAQTLPSWLLEAGRRWSKVWTTVQSEFNDKFGTQQFPGALQLENQVGAFAQQLTVTDKAMREQGRLGFEFTVQNPKTGKDEVIRSFLPYAEALMHNELHESMQAQYMYGKKQTRPADDAYWTKTGAGFREQLSESWRDFYSGPLDITTIRDFLLDIFHSRVDETDRNVVMMTGALGQLLFHDAVASQASGFLTVDNNFIERRPDKARRLLSFGAQFTHYQGPNGVEVSLMHTPVYDSKKYSKLEHPLYPGYTIDSGRMTFLDFGSTRQGTSGVSNNISIVSVKDTFRHFCITGSVGPMGPMTGGEKTSVAKAGYDVYVEGTGGLWIKDVTRAGELILDYEF